MARLWLRSGVWLRAGLQRRSQRESAVWPPCEQLEPGRRPPRHSAAAEACVMCVHSHHHGFQSGALSRFRIGSLFIFASSSAPTIEAFRACNAHTHGAWLMGTHSRPPQLHARLVLATAHWNRLAPAPESAVFDHSRAHGYTHPQPHSSPLSTSISGAPASTRSSQTGWRPRFYFSGSGRSHGLTATQIGCRSRPAAPAAG